MPTPFVLLKCLGRALLKGGLRALAAGLPLGEVLFEVAQQTQDDWQTQKREEDRRAELEAVAQAAAQEVRHQVAEIVAEVAAGQPEEVRRALAGYLTQVPATIRQSLRRAADPTGTTVPSGLRLRKAEDLLRFLPPQLPHFKEGDRPAGIGDWELVELLGIGGFGEVWKACNVHRPKARPAALKFCLDASSAALLRNEVDLLDRVAEQGKHPGLVQLLHTYLSTDPPCLEYEYVEGGDLAGLIQEWHQCRGGPMPAQAGKVILRLAEIVAFTHQLRPPLVHRDLKPANILVRQGEGGDFQFKIADFGIGGLAAPRALKLTTRPGFSRGELLATMAHGSYTALYASPQQMRGEGPDPRDDVHALGVIWYQLLTGDLTSGVPGGLQWMDDLKQRGMSEALIRVLASCFEAQPGHRPADAGDLAGRLAALLPVGPLAATAGPEVGPLEPVFLAPVPVSPPTPGEPQPAGREYERPRPVAQKHPRAESAVGKAETPAPAAEAVYWPALFELILGMALGLGALVLFMGSLGFSADPDRPPLLLGGVAGLVVATFLITGGLKLLRLASYEWALFTGVLTTVLGVLALPALGAGLLILPLGVSTLAVLSRPEVRSAFGVERLEGPWKAVYGRGLAQLILGVVLGFGALVLFILSLALRPSEHAPMVFGGIAAVAVSVILITGGLKMVKLESYQWAMFIGVLATVLGGLAIPAMGAGLLILPVGVSTLKVLKRPEVRSAFGVEELKGAREMVYWPALFQLILGVFWCFGAALLFILSLALERVNFYPTRLPLILGGIVAASVATILINGGFRLFRLQSYTFAMFIGVLTTTLGILTLPAFGAGLLILPIGISTLKVLKRPEVRSAFR
jgi:hypothetical protein